MKLLLLTDHFAPGYTSGARLMTELAEGLQEKGLEVSVICALGSGDLVTPTGLRVQRVPLLFGRNKRMILRLMSEVIFSIQVAWNLLRYRQINHILVLASPPFLYLFVGLMARFLQIPYSVIIMDIYPDIAVPLVNMSQRNLVYRLWDVWSVWILKQSHQVIVLGCCMQQRIQEKSTLIKTKVIQNWVKATQVSVIQNQFNPYLEHYPELRGKFVIQYAGNIGLAQDFAPILEAASKLQNHSNIFFAIIGDGVKKLALAQAIMDQGLRNIQLYPFVPQEQQELFLATASVALITLEQGLEGLAVPSKLYPIMAAGKPVIALLDVQSEVGLTVSKHQLGLVLGQSEKSKLSEAILEIYQNTNQYLADRIRRVFLENFEYNIAIARYHEAVTKVVN